MAIGSYAGDAITSGTRNVLMGYRAGTALDNDNDNTFVGYNAGSVNIGQKNTAVGSHALGHADCTGESNVAIGYNALGSATADESDNIAIGDAALYGLVNGAADNNIGLGTDAGRYFDTDPTDTPGSGSSVNTAGANSIYIGHQVYASSAGPSNEICIGYHSISNGDNRITLGNENIGAIHCAEQSISALSDRRIKRDVKDAENIGLAFVEKLNAIEYKRLNPADWPEEIRSSHYRVLEREELVTPAVKAQPEVWEEAVAEVTETIEHAATEAVTETIVHPAVEEIVETTVIPAVEEVTETITIPAVEEVTETIITPATEAVYEDVIIPAITEETEERVTQEAQEEIIGERQTYDETEVSEDVERVEMVKGEGDEYVRKVITETVTRTECTPLYDEHPVVNEDGTPCLKTIEPAVEAKEAVVREIPAVTEEQQVLDENGEGVIGEDGNPVMETVELEPARTEVIEEAVEAKPAVTEQVIHLCPIMEEYVQQEAREEVVETFVIRAAEPERTESRLVTPAQEERTEIRVVTPAEEERTETRVVVEAAPERTETRIVQEAQAERTETVVIKKAQDAWTETKVITPASERRLVSPAIEAQDAVYETVTVPADERPEDNDTNYVGLIAQDVQTAMTDAGVDFDLVTEGANGKLAVKYSNLVIPLLKAVQELSAEVKALKNG